MATQQKKLRATIVGEQCIYCGAPAQEYEHVIPKSLHIFFDAGWNLAPSCRTCNRSKNNTIAVKHIQTPGNDPWEDAAIWAAVYNTLDAPASTKADLVDRMRVDVGKWDFMGRSSAYGAFEVYVGEHLHAFGQ